MFFDRIFFVIPVYGSCSPDLPGLFMKIYNMAMGMPTLLEYKIIFVVDGDIDLMHKISSQFSGESRVKCILRWRGGQHSAIFSAIEFIKKNEMQIKDATIDSNDENTNFGTSNFFVAVMDQDDDPSYFPLLASIMREKKADTVVGLVQNKERDFWRNVGTYFFYCIVCSLMRLKSPKKAPLLSFKDIRLLSTYSLVLGDTIIKMKRTSNYILSLFLSAQKIEFSRLPRRKQNECSSYSFYQLLSLSIRTIVDIIRFQI